MTCEVHTRVHDGAIHVAWAEPCMFATVGRVCQQDWESVSVESPPTREYLGHNGRPEGFEDF